MNFIQMVKARYNGRVLTRRIEHRMSDMHAGSSTWDWYKSIHTGLTNQTKAINYLLCWYGPFMLFCGICIGGLLFLIFG